MKTVSLLSGGMDSTTLLYYLLEQKHEVFVISFDYGSKHNHKELGYARWHCEQLNISHTIVELPFINQLFNSSLLQSGDAIPHGHYEDAVMKKTVVPFRNGIMLSIAGGYAESIEADAVAIASHAGDHAIYPDCRASFNAVMDLALRRGTYGGITLLTPYAAISKAAIVAIGLGLGVDYNKTWSCYEGGDIPCGKCGTCVEWIEALELNGILILGQNLIR